MRRRHHDGHDGRLDLLATVAPVSPSATWPVLALALVALAASAMAGCSSSEPTYAACVGQHDCASPDACYRLLFTRTDGSNGEGNFCSRPCASDRDCPGAGTCLGFAADTAHNYLCMAGCDDTHPCPYGLLCTPVDGAASARSVCLP